jgi:streptomycin 6-kinase
MVFDRFLAFWHLTPDGDPIATRSSRLLPVRCRDGTAAAYAGLFRRLGPG